MRGGEAMDEATRPRFSLAGTSSNNRFYGKIASRWREFIRQLALRFTWIYQRVVVELILRRKALAKSDGRHIPLRIDHDSPLFDPRRGHSYIPNTIRTSRYTIWDFIPKQLLFQFTRVGNFYFLCVGIPQMIPGLSTTGSYTTILPLMFFVLLTIFKEGYDDYKRHRLDQVENANFATVLRREDKSTGVTKKSSLLDRLNPFLHGDTTPALPASEESHEGFRWLPTRWRDIQVGHIVRLSRDEPIPADIVLIHSDGENGLAYIETMALDGETNLKSKQVAHAFENCDTISGISRCQANFVVEDPNPDLHSFDGRVTVGENKPVPLTINEIVYRGSILRNTTCAIGVVVNTGEECKIRMNSNQHPNAKKPALERMNNKIVVTLASYVVLLSVGVSMGYVKWQREYEHNAWYLTFAKVPFHQIIIAFIIMFNNVVPLSLYVTLEIVKVGQLLMLNSDLKMYDEETDTPARCNTNTILEDLGQIGIIFSDKTGTLTNNIMKFRKISIAGTIWLHEMDLQAAESGSIAEGLSSCTSTAGSVLKIEPIKLAVPNDHRPDPLEPPNSTPRPSMGGGRRSSSHWRSTGRPDHVQPEVNTEDLMEYLRLRPHSAFARKARDYLLAMALCHTCLPELKDGQIEYQASSPDELALVKAARELGYSVVQRTSRSITLRIADHDSLAPAEEKTYEILDVVEFSSARKRMSIVVRYPDGRITVICKGADSAILPRLKMSSLAMQKAHEVRESADLEHEKFRRSEHQRARGNITGTRQSLTIRRNPAPSMEHRRLDGVRSQSFEAGRLMPPTIVTPRASFSARGASFDVQKTSYLSAHSHHTAPLPERYSFLEGPHMYDESESFSKCFQHLEEFATEGLRTLLYAQRFISESDYQSWKKLYDEATTCLVDRQERIEKAGELIEQSFDLVGATAIEDKLQKGVPDTIDRLRRANIKIWMLTGDKRETAINIAHSARLCRPGSDIYILDVAKGALESQIMDLKEDLEAGSVHSVVVIDGQTLAKVESSPELSSDFYAVMLLVDSVICCRASPAQKALLVRTVRSQLRTSPKMQTRGLTLAIGDGANDLAMIQASHVGVGISGKEGLQAARVADYSIAQFRFLQRLLLVHGRWNYVRTAKFIICTYWKEMFFYLSAAQYQRYNGYTGTSLYEAASLTVFNTLFTSLCTICMGIWEQDLQAETLLAIPELYVFGQRNKGLNLQNYVLWMLLAVVEGVICWYGAWAGYGWIVPSGQDHKSLYSLGQLVFTIGVFWINWKLFIFETHFKTGIVMFSFFLTTWGWFAWNAFLSGVYAKFPSGPYAIRDSFTQLWGRDPTWWATLFMVLSFLGLMELVGKLVIKQLSTSGQNGSSGNMEDWDLETWQEMEQNPEVKQYLERLARDGDDEDDLYDDVMEMGIDSTDLPGDKGGTFREHVIKLGSMLPSLNRAAAK
ncbi:unnamed protein product [Clonostachys solani]|uniref:Phospholipid-transporting ATPase n=1 Tax=Clonostachys solani TaxID=160281 RepID=A0A9N9Z5Q4_9HYPO|nr:unnamed protein product [Clonostachys solani]